MSFKLMLKQHNVTGLKYLCVTKKDDPFSYTGSGIYQKRHLGTHGKDFSTEILFESETKDEEFIKACHYYSELQDVANSKEFANLIIENGNSSQVRAENFTEEQSKRQRESIKEFQKSERGLEVRKSHSKVMKDIWKADRDKRVEHLRLVFDSKEYRESLSQGQKRRYSNYDEDDWKRVSETIRSHRLNMSPEKKKLRAERVREAYKTSDSRKAYEEKMKVDRKGKGNPAATIWNIDNQYLSTGELHQYCVEQGLNVNATKKKLEELGLVHRKAKKPTEIFTCKHCGLQTTSKGLFNRWHNDNCKENK